MIKLDQTILELFVDHALQATKNFIWSILLLDGKWIHILCCSRNLHRAYALIPPHLENWPFHRAKMIAQCISARQPTGLRAIGQLLLLTRKGHRQKKFGRATSDAKKLVKFGPLREKSTIQSNDMK